MSRTLYKAAITLWVVLLAIAILVGGFGAMLDFTLDRHQWGWLVSILGGGGLVLFLAGGMLEFWARRDAN